MAVAWESFQTWNEVLGPIEHPPAWWSKALGGVGGLRSLASWWFASKTLKLPGAWHHPTSSESYRRLHDRPTISGMHAKLL